MIALDYFLLNEPQLSTAGFVALFFILSALVGLILRRPLAEGSAFGFLILTGSANLSLYIFRPLGLPTAAFGFAVFGICLLIGWILRRVVFQKRAPKEPLDWFYMSVVAAMTVILWAGNILHPDPDANFSAQHGWLPLYVEGSFKAGHFLLIEEMNFGPGLMSGFYYFADLIGMVSLAAWFGAGQVYPAYNASSMLAAMLAFAVLFRALRGNRLALAAFFGLSLAFFAVDPYFRVVLGGNWGDVPMYLGGALILYYLAAGNGLKEALLAATAASIFLVFSRHYGAFLSGVVMILLFAVAWFHGKQRDIRPWFILGLMLITFSLREIYYIIYQPTPYYPGTWVVERAPYTFKALVLGALTDWGLLKGSDPGSLLPGWRNIYLVVLAVLLFVQRQKIVRQRRRLLIYLAPCVVMAAPLVLQAVTGYRTNPIYSKFYIVGIFFLAWYPAYLACFLFPAKALPELTVKRGAALFGALAVVSILVVSGVSSKVELKRLFSDGPGQYIQWAFQRDIVDREIARRMKSALGDEASERPVLYLYYEPGITLRHYLGGDFFKDYDYWSEAVLEKSRSANNLYELLGYFNYPNIYIGLPDKTGYVEFLADERRKFKAAFQAIEQMPWAEKIIEYGGAKMIIVARPKK